MKKLISIIMILCLCFVLAGCNNKNKNKNDTASLTVWGSSDDQDMLKEMADDFGKAFKDLTVDIAVKVTGEDVAKDEALKDIDAAADVFAVSHDQVGALVEAGAIYEITGEYKENVISSCTENSVKAATYNDALYGFPSSAETYVLYYDKSKLTEQDVTSLDAMLKKGTDKYSAFGMNLEEGYYGTSFFFTAGCTLFGENGEDPDKCDFNNENGQKAAKLISTLKERGVINCDENEALSQIKAGKLASFVTGPWKAQAMKEALGANFGVAKLPTVNIGGEQRQMESFAGYKIYVVNAKTKNPAEAMKLAAHLTNESSQLKRFAKRDAIPVNELAAEDEAITKNETIVATLEQLENARAMPATTQISVYWTAFKSFAIECFEGKIDDNNLKAKLDNMVKQITVS